MLEIIAVRPTFDDWCSLVVDLLLRTVEHLLLATAGSDFVVQHVELPVVVEDLSRCIVHGCSISFVHKSQVVVVTCH
jgi:hypothetical protein